MTEDMQGWFDIYTAPKDGSSILVTRHNGQHYEDPQIVRWDTRKKRTPYKWLTEDNAYAPNHFDLWQPLPQSPFGDF